MRRLLAAPLLLLPAALLLADGPGDNIPAKVRPIPPAGITLDAEQKRKLQEGVEDLGKVIASLRRSLADRPVLLDLLPDVEVFHKAVSWALKYNEFYSPQEVKLALGTLLPAGHARARELAAGKPTWTRATGLVVRGFRSKIDGSVQPYGLVVPASYSPGTPHRHRLDVWLHGRGEKSLEVAFLGDRLRNPGKFTPPHTFVLHPFGRYCNAFKFAGEVDVLEALDHVQKHYPIDPDRRVLRGFSMGGAGCWQIACHYPDLWAAAAPGAGFSETEEFLRVFQHEKLSPTDYERRLWQMYDCPTYAANFFNLPVVAYSGEKDRQKQAADVMAKALGAEGIELVHLIGPNTEHDYHPQTKVELARRIDILADRGRDRVPPRVRFRTPTLRYNRSFWVTIDALPAHWRPASIDARLVEGKEIAIHTFKSVSGFTLSFGAGDFPLSLAPRPVVEVDGQEVPAVPMRSDRSWSCSFHKVGEEWREGKAKGKGLVKRHGLQGPIDDAFLDRFLMVRPTGKGWHGKTDAWVRGELAHALTHWRQQFRGDAPVKDDRDVTEDDVASSNLVLWGDPSSNAVLKKVIDKLPLAWSEKEVKLGRETFDAAHHVPLLIYPNPLNPARYVVLNSSFTYREYDYLNNARQVPKLPDYAVVDVRTPPSTQAPGKVVTTGFFTEGWQVGK